MGLARGASFALFSSFLHSSVLRSVNSERLRGSREVQSAGEVNKNGESLNKIQGQINAQAGECKISCVIFCGEKHFSLVGLVECFWVLQGERGKTVHIDLKAYQIQEALNL